MRITEKQARAYLHAMREQASYRMTGDWHQGERIHNMICQMLALGSNAWPVFVDVEDEPCAPMVPVACQPGRPEAGQEGRSQQGCGRGSGQRVTRKPKVLEAAKHVSWRG